MASLGFELCIVTVMVWGEISLIGSRVRMLGLQVFNCFEGLGNLWGWKVWWKGRGGFQGAGFQGARPALILVLALSIQPLLFLLKSELFELSHPPCHSLTLWAKKQASLLFEAAQVFRHWKVDPAVLVLDPLTELSLARCRWLTTCSTYLTYSHFHFLFSTFLFFG